MKIKMKRKVLADAISNNPADSQYYWSQHLCPHTGDIVSLSNTEDGRRYQTLIPLPSMNPEGSGDEIDRFQEFSETPPDSVKIADYADSGLDIDAYMEFAKGLGWDTVKADWENWEQAHLDFLINEFVDNIQTGSADGCSLSIDDDFPEVHIEFI